MSSTYKTDNFGLNKWELDDCPQMEDFNYDNAQIDKALTALLAGTFEIPVSSWGHSSTYAGYGFQAVLAIPGATSGDLVRADFGPVTLPIAEAAEVMSAGDTITGGVIFYAAHEPTGALSGMYTVCKAVT